MDLRFKDINTSFDLQQNPLRSYEFPCNKIYKGARLGACSYLLLLDYPSDVKVYISLNSNREQAIQIDNRNTGFRISEVFSKEGIKSFAQDVQLWTEGITNLVELDGTPKKIRIITSNVVGFEALNNSSINSIKSIGEIGKINAIGGFPQTATIKSIFGYEPQWNNQNKWIQIKKDNISPYKKYALAGKIIIDTQAILAAQSYAISLRLVNPLATEPKYIEIANFCYNNNNGILVLGGFSDSTIEISGSELLEFIPKAQEIDGVIYDYAIMMWEQSQSGDNVIPNYSAQMAFYEA